MTDMGSKPQVCYFLDLSKLASNTLVLSTTASSSDRVGLR